MGLCLGNKVLFLRQLGFWGAVRGEFIGLNLNCFPWNQFVPNWQCYIWGAAVESLGSGPGRQNWVDRSGSLLGVLLFQASPCMLVCSAVNSLGCAPF